jgi:hypothetical protein
MKLSSFFYTVFLMLFAAAPLCATTRASEERPVLTPAEQEDLNWRLFKACGQKKLFEVKQLLAQGADVNMFTTFGTTPLHEATFISDEKIGRNIDIIRLLLDKNANVNAAYYDGLTVLYWAGQLRHPDDQELIRLLLDRGADLYSARISSGEMPLHQLVLTGRQDVIDMVINATPEASKSYLKRQMYMIAKEKGIYPIANKTFTLCGLAKDRVKALSENAKAKIGQSAAPEIDSSAAYPVVHVASQNLRILEDRAIRAKQDLEYQEALEIDRARAASLAAPAKLIVGNETSDTESDVEQTPSPEELRALQLRAIADRSGN